MRIQRLSRSTHVNTLVDVCLMHIFSFLSPVPDCRCLVHLFCYRCLQMWSADCRRFTSGKTNNTLEVDGPSLHQEDIAQTFFNETSSEKQSVRDNLYAWSAPRRQKRLRKLFKFIITLLS
ncbi:hypothetical protein HanIR_Chr11g0555561 [Helianthus annuus]|nr:hypothetical protein HanIR_Chr11g0555561 [Helianthus annuus]